MGDEEGTSSNVKDNCTAQGVESAMDDEQLGGDGVARTEQCDSVSACVPELDDSQFDGAEGRGLGYVKEEGDGAGTAKEEEEGNVVVEGEEKSGSSSGADALTVDGGAELADFVKENEVGTVAAGDGEEKSVLGGSDLTVGSAELEAVVKDEDAETVVAEEGNVVVGVGEEKSVAGTDNLPVIGAEFAAVVRVNEAEAVAAEEGNTVVAGGVVADGEEKSDSCADDLPAGDAELAAIAKEGEKGIPVGGTELVAVVKEGDVAVMEDDALTARIEMRTEREAAVTGGMESTSQLHFPELTDMGASGFAKDDNVGEAAAEVEREAAVNDGMECSSQLHFPEVAEVRQSDFVEDDHVGEATAEMEREAAVSGGTESISRLHFSEIAEVGASGFVEDDYVGTAAAEMETEAGLCAGGDDVTKAIDEEGTAGVEEEKEEVPLEETKTGMETRVESEAAPGSDIFVTEDDVTAFKDDEVQREVSKDSDDTGANVGDASDQDEEDDMEMESKMKDSEGGSLPEHYDSEQPGALSPMAANEDEDDAPMAEEEIQTMDTEMETETEVELGKGVRGKRKRGRNPRVPSARTPARKTVGEDVCFICFDGGDLVLCDRR